MIEFHRFGGPQAMNISPDCKYIRTTAWGEPAREVSPGFDYQKLIENLNVLRYENIGTPGDVRGARGQYINWWIAANGFFPGRQDLSTDAAQIVPLLM
jgi:hypothetical protein